MLRPARLLSVVALSCALGAGCAKLPAECSDEALAKASDVEALGEKTFAIPGVRDTMAKVAEAREAIARETPRWAILRDYDDAKVLCDQATILANETRAEILEAKKRKAEVDAVMVTNNNALDEAGLAILTGRALLDAVPEPALDEKLRAIQKKHREVNNETNLALAELTGGGFTGDVEGITKHRAAMTAAVTEANQVVLDIRRAATAACKPTATVTTEGGGGGGKAKAGTPLFIGPGRARAHDGFAVVEAGLGEEQASGYIAVVARGEDGTCRTLSTSKADAPDAMPIGPIGKMRTWNIGGDIPTRLLTAWLAPRIWFVGDVGSWSFDAAKVAGFEGKCGSVTCTDPDVRGDRVDVSCTCHSPTDPRELDLSRSVRFSWQGNAVLAER